MDLKGFFKRHIRNTPEKAIVIDRKIFLCNLTNAVLKGIELDDSIKGTYITSRCLKHLYDKKPAEEFDFILNHLLEVVKHPDRIYKNLPGKRGSFCFVKRLGNEEYFCTIEILEIPPAVCGEAELGVSQLGQNSIAREIQIATAFKLRDEKYIKNYTLLWDWGDGDPHRSALDAPEESTHAPQ